MKVKKYFLTGIITLLPLIVTIYTTKFVFELIDGFLEPLIVLRFGRQIPGIGFLITLLLIFLTGLVMSNYFGRKIIARLEILVDKIPIMNVVYTSVKKVIEALRAQNKEAFKRVVLVEYPRKGTYALGFVTGEGMGEVQEKTEQYVMNVFIPTTPNPTSGMLLLVPKEDVIFLEMSVDEGLKLIVSGGVICPEYNGNCK